MYNRTRPTHEPGMVVTNPSLAALVRSMLAVGLGPVAVIYLVGHPALGGGLLLGIGLSQLMTRLNGWEASAHQPSNPGRTTEPSVRFERPDGQQVPAQTSSD